MSALNGGGWANTLVRPYVIPEGNARKDMKQKSGTWCVVARCGEIAAAANDIRSRSSISCHSCFPDQVRDRLGRESAMLIAVSTTKNENIICIMKDNPVRGELVEP